MGCENPGGPGTGDKITVTEVTVGRRQGGEKKNHGAQNFVHEEFCGDEEVQVPVLNLGSFRVMKESLLSLKTLPIFEVRGLGGLLLE